MTQANDFRTVPTSRMKGGREHRPDVGRLRGRPEANGQGPRGISFPGDGRDALQHGPLDAVAAHGTWRPDGRRVSIDVPRIGQPSGQIHPSESTRSVGTCQDRVLSGHIEIRPGEWAYSGNAYRKDVTALRAAVFPYMMYTTVKFDHPVFVGTGTDDHDVDPRTAQYPLVKAACEAGSTIEQQ